MTFSALVSEQVVGQATARESAQGRISVNQGRREVSISSDQYDYIYLSADLKSKAMVPIIMRLKSHSIESFGDLIAHGGEEFIYVLSGTVEVHTQYYQTKKLKTGDSMYLDSRMGHGFIAAGNIPAELLTVATEPVTGNV